MRSLALLLCALFSSLSLAQPGGTGWDPNRGPREAAVFAATLPPYLSKQVQFLVATSDDRDALNYRFVARCLGEDRLTLQNQGQLGSCVGFGTAHAVETVVAADILHRRQREVWQARASGGGIYALSRTIPKQLGSWEGSTGAWACQALQSTGVIWQKDYGQYPLSRYDIGLIRRWQQQGVPQEIIESAKKFPVRGCLLIKTTAELKAGLQNGYAAVLCASWSFKGQRDQLGFAARDGRDSWNHAMACTAYRGQSSGREGFLIPNSWGTQWISGGVWPEDQPEGSFWATPEDIQRALSQGDSWLIGDVVGFPKRELSWEEALSIGGRDEHASSGVQELYRWADSTGSAVEAGLRWRESIRAAITEPYRAQGEASPFGLRIHTGQAIHKHRAAFAIAG